MISNTFQSETFFPLSQKDDVSHYFVKQADVPHGGVYDVYVIVSGILTSTAGFVQ